VRTPLRSRRAEGLGGRRDGGAGRKLADVLIVLSDDRLALIPVLRDGHQADAAYLIHPSSLLDAFSELFEAVWDRAVVVNKSGQGQPDPFSDATPG
jgi:hypothetical protein